MAFPKEIINPETGTRWDLKKVNVKLFPIDEDGYQPCQKIKGNPNHAPMDVYEAKGFPYYIFAEDLENDPTNDNPKQLLFKTFIEV